MKQVEDTKEDFESDYYHYSGNNSYYVNSTLIPESKHFTEENWKIYESINISEEDAIDKLGDPNFVADWGNPYWIFEHNGSKFYYQNDRYKGSTIGIWVKKADKSKNWLFEPIEFDCQSNSEIGKKLLDFTKELNELIKE